jgi:hypothetical protein
MNTSQAVNALLKQVTKRFPRDRFVPGVLFSFLPGERNDKPRRVMDGTLKKYDVKPGKDCVYGCIKRFNPEDQIVLTYKGTSILQVAIALSKELRRVYPVKNAEVASSVNDNRPAGTSNTYCKFCGRDTDICKAEPCPDSARGTPTRDFLGLNDPKGDFRG